MNTEERDIERKDPGKGESKMKKRKHRESISQKTVMAQIKDLQKHDYTDPDFKAARKYGDRKQFLRKNKDTQKLEPIEFCCKDSELERFYAGIALYFKFLKFFALTFIVLSLCSAYMIYINYQESEYFKEKNEQPQLLWTTLGNTNKVQIDGDHNDEFIGNVEDPIKNLKIIRYCDLFTLMVFSILLAFYKLKSKKLAH